MSNTTKLSKNSKKEALENSFQALSFTLSYLQGRNNSLNPQNACFEISSLIQEAEELLSQISKCKHRGSFKLRKQCTQLLDELETQYEYHIIFSDNDFLGK